ncbi:hypothetical protein CcI49_19860 [Frankia sp. CcI49]|uniref:FHA domain-containing protein n=1 Tax=Frankia sp. CcI49 TaxID=1745382 RepID=UPI0009764BD9|nr:FHA domain-containing protein [Frankia sp. CcI49]ONH58967.1 hypothetical protein CcI49_19860 [Frankia sp. CcI49]
MDNVTAVDLAETRFRLGAPDGPEIILTPFTGDGDVTAIAGSRSADVDTTFDDQPRLHPLRPGTLRLGRVHGNDITVSDLLASRHHTELHIRGEIAEIVDLDSANGTFVSPASATDRISLSARRYLSTCCGSSMSTGRRRANSARLARPVRGSWNAW